MKDRVCWIKTSEILPKEHTDVLCACRTCEDTIYITMGYYDTINGWELQDDRGYLEFSVVAWSEIPPLLFP